MTSSGSIISISIIAHSDVEPPIIPFFCLRPTRWSVSVSVSEWMMVDTAPHLQYTTCSITKYSVDRTKNLICTVLCCAVLICGDLIFGRSHTHPYSNAMQCNAILFNGTRLDKTQSALINSHFDSHNPIFLSSGTGQIERQTVIPTAQYQIISYLSFSFICFSMT
jgi:hypothetical protein